MGLMESWELASYVITVIGLPIAIFIFTVEQRKQRANEQSEIQQTLADSYTDFLKLVLANPDLRLLGSRRTPDLSQEQDERMRAIYSILVSLFERAFVLTWAPRMSDRDRRYFSSWEDLMHEWCTREDFRAMLPQLLVGEDVEFARHISQLAQDAARQ